jgi:hypothetical protein
MELTLWAAFWHLVSRTFEVAPRFLENLWIVVFMLTYFFGHRLFLVRVQDSPYINLVGKDRKYVMLIRHYCATERTALILNACVSSFFQLQCPVITFSLSPFQKSGRHMTSPNFSVPLVSRIDFMRKWRCAVLRFKIHLKMLVTNNQIQCNVYIMRVYEISKNAHSERQS